MDLDKPIRPDVQSVLNAAAILDITEYDLFHVAYSRWHGRRADEHTMEPIFVAYMFNEVVPQWVRHFTRLVERLNRSGKLERSALGIHVRPASQRMARRGLRYAVAVVTYMAVLFVIAQFAAEVMKIGERCYFPPCY